MACSPDILKQVSESYRKIRNTARFLIGNMADFDYATMAVDYKDMTEIDRLAMHNLQCLIEKVLAAYENYEFHVAYHAIHKFCVLNQFFSSIHTSVKRLIYIRKQRAMQ